MEVKCSATGAKVTNQTGTVIFPCPKCLKTTIVRSPLARKTSAKYTCSECGFEGPN